MDIRYYKGFFKMELLKLMDKKAMVRYLENALVGNKTDGMKEVKLNDKDIVLTRHCYKQRNELLIYHLINNVWGKSKK